MRTNLAILLALVALFAALMPVYQRRVARDHQSECASNFKKIETAMEAYSTDNAGRYPGRRDWNANWWGDRRVPWSQIDRYLDGIPTCPSGEPYRITAAVAPDIFTVVCGGHPRTGYSSVSGYTSDRRAIEGWK